MSRQVSLDLLYGILLLLACHVLYIVTAWLFFLLLFAIGAADWIFPGDNYALLTAVFFAVLATGLVQLLYAIPLYRRFKRNGRPQLSDGIAIAAGFTLFLSTGCFFSSIVNS